MKELFTYFIKSLMYLWQFPQHLLGIILLYTRPVNKKILYNTSKVFIISKGYFAVSLGQYIFINEKFSKNPMEKLIPHEYGHSIQSKMLGPLYLILVGIPSIMQNLLSNYLSKKGYPKMSQNYYKRYPENWADKLGKVVR